MPSLPELRLSTLRDEPPAADGKFVLYWMIGARRTHWNFALDRAVHWAVELGKPLLVLEPLRVGYPWASDRLHHFVIQGMADNAAHLARTPVGYYPYLEPEAGTEHELLAALTYHKQKKHKSK